MATSAPDTDVGLACGRCCSSGKTLSASKQGAKSSNDRGRRMRGERDSKQRRMPFMPCAAAAR
jgi:hypothetical protein